LQPRFAYVIAALLFAAGTTLAFATIESAHGPLPSVTGAAALGGKPEEWNCTLCHSGDRDNLNTPGGRVEILNIPRPYTPGQTYPLTVRLRSDSTAYSATRHWGFELTAVRKSNGTGVGTFVLPNPDTLQIVMGDPAGDFASRAYVEHTFIGTRAGLAGPVQWTFSWRAPATDVGMIYFFCAGNAADGTFDPGNDFIFTTSDSAIGPGSVEVPASIAARTTLAPPWPNPARGPVSFGYSLAARSRIDVAIFDLQGRKVRQLVSGWHDAGVDHVVWDAQGDDGATVSNGTYFARLAVRGEATRLSRKVTIGR